MNEPGQDRIIVPLEFPLKVKGSDGYDMTIHQVEVGRIKAKHLSLFPLRFFEEEGQVAGAEWLPIIQGLTRLPKESVDEMDGKDVLAVVRVIRENFL